MARPFRTKTRSVRLSPAEDRALELEAERRSGVTKVTVHDLIRAELFPFLRSLRRKHADAVAHLPHGAD